ncbi:hypothetical protein OA93_06845 [Flavobacterium sp. KMS]|jgi:hypothetical protein|uniref:hypothetical protein n=1 Tax=Flavobacterium sp. KMS TaxID=1566023 RepID=UPI000580ADC6|nr:hypothetical protein [Flavobacterium sp. KMS]KIA99333.1 hypothetical protein OA93_06845 [Flavobacterium sp. KMS]
MSTTNLNVEGNEVITMPPGTKIFSENNNPEIGKVTFPERKSKGLLSPLVEAFYNAENDTLSINIVAYVDLDRRNEVFQYDIFQNTYIDIDGNPQLQFFIAYNMPEQDACTFSVHELKFKANPYAFIGDFSKVKTIQTFLWDIDPIASRGTETTVQSGG